jgi:hypothetical protein
MPVYRAITILLDAFIKKLGDKAIETARSSLAA